MEDFVSDAEIRAVVVGTYRYLLAAAIDPDECGLIVYLMQQAEMWQATEVEPRLAPRPRRTLH